MSWSLIPCSTAVTWMEAVFDPPFSLWLSAYRWVEAMAPAGTFLLAATCFQNRHHNHEKWLYCCCKVSPQLPPPTSCFCLKPLFRWINNRQSNSLENSNRSIPIFHVKTASSRSLSGLHLLFIHPHLLKCFYASWGPSAAPLQPLTCSQAEITSGLVRSAALGVRYSIMLREPVSVFYQSWTAQKRKLQLLLQLFGENFLLK